MAGVKGWRSEEKGKSFLFDRSEFYSPTTPGLFPFPRSQKSRSGRSKSSIVSGRGVTDYELDES